MHIRMWQCLCGRVSGLGPFYYSLVVLFPGEYVLISAYQSASHTLIWMCVFVASLILSLSTTLYGSIIHPQELQ